MNLRLTNASDLPSPQSPRTVQRVAELRFVASFEPRTREDYEFLIRLVRQLARERGIICSDEDDSMV